MKTIRDIVFLFGFVLLILAACTPSVKVVGTDITPSPELSAIDSLMWHRPDSALLVLMAYEGDTGAFNSHYTQLLASELLYKNDYAQTNRTELLQAVAYFDSLLVLADTRDASKKNAQNMTIAFLDARAHYINGVGYYESDSVVEACKEYLKALGVMEVHFEEKELTGHKAMFMAFTYTRLTELFSDLYFHEQTIYFAKLALPYFEIENSSSWHQAWVMNEIGSHYNMMEQLDSADLYYNKASLVLNNPNNPIYRDIVTHQLYLIYKRGHLIDSIIAELHNLLSKTDTPKEYYSRCAVIGEVYYHEKQFDSAWFYLNKVFYNTTSDASKKQAAEWLVEICKEMGKDDGILEYAEFLVPFANQEENQSEIKSQLAELYKNYSQNRLVKLHQQEKKKYQKWAISIAGGLIVVMLTIAFYLHRNKRKKQHLEVQIKEAQYAHDMQQKALSGRLKKSNETLRKALKKIEENEADNELIENKDKKHILGQQKYEAFVQTPICQEIFDKVQQLHADKRKTLKTDMNVADYNSFALTARQLASLSKAADEYYPELYVSLKKRHPSISQKDWKFCLLYLLQLDKLSICILLQESYHTCRRYTMKLEHIFNCQHGLSVFLIDTVYIL